MSEYRRGIAETFGAGGRNHLSNPERGRLIRLE